MKQAMIFAAGLGTRLKPLTDHKPKALVSVEGEPLLKRVILRLKDCGFQRIVVNVHHFSDQIIDYLKANNNFGADLSISDETDHLLDTGGGLKYAAHLFDPSSPILIHNVDILSNVDFDFFYHTSPLVPCPDCGIPHKAGALLMVSWRSTKRYLIFQPSTLRLVGWTNIDTHEVISPYEELRQGHFKPTPSDDGSGRLMFSNGQTAFPMYAFSGLHVVYPTLFKAMDSWPESFPILNFYLTVCRDIPIKGVLNPGLKLIDVGKMATLGQASAFLNNQAHDDSPQKAG